MEPANLPVLREGRTRERCVGSYNEGEVGPCAKLGQNFLSSLSCSPHVTVGCADEHLREDDLFRVLEFVRMGSIVLLALVFGDTLSDWLDHIRYDRALPNQFSVGGRLRFTRVESLPP